MGRARHGQGASTADQRPNSKHDQGVEYLNKKQWSWLVAGVSNKSLQFFKLNPAWAAKTEIEIMLVLSRLLSRQWLEDEKENI